MFGDPRIDDLNVASQTPLPAPQALRAELPLLDSAARTVLEARATLVRILERRDLRLFVIVGPSSIHDPDAALDYGRRLATRAGLACNIVVDCSHGNSGKDPARQPLVLADCVHWPMTEKTLRAAREKLKAVLAERR